MIYYFTISKIVSGDVDNSITAHNPAPISFTLAPRRYALFIVDNQEAVMISVGQLYKRNLWILFIVFL